MAKFSESFFESLRGAGRRGSPTDPMLQRQAGPQYGSTDPLARSLGGMLGMDMRTAPELATAELSKVDQTDPNSLIQALGVQAKYEQDPQKKVLYMLEIDKIKKETAKENELKALADQKDERYSAMAKTIIDKSPEIASLISQGDQQAYEIGLKMLQPSETLSPKDRYKQVGKRIFDVTTASFIGDLPDENKKYATKEIVNSKGEVEIIWYDESDPNVVVRTEKPPQDKQPVALFKRGTELLTEANRAQAQAESALTLATQFDEIKPKGGAYRTVKEFIDNVAGSQDKVTRLYEQGRNLITSRAAANLPKGPASDKDVALVLRGEPPMNADGAYLASYARGVAKLLRKEAKLARDNSYWLDKYSDERGFTAYLSSSRLRQELNSIPENIKQDLEKNKENPQIVRDFELKYGFNYFDAKQELNQTESILKDLGRTL
jgi:hypothetical protein